MDLSDGLAVDLGRLARASGVQIVIENIPMSAASRKQYEEMKMNPLNEGAAGGEEFCLLGTCPVESWPKVQNIIQAYPVGYCKEGNGLIWPPGCDPSESYDPFSCGRLDD